MKSLKLILLITAIALVPLGLGVMVLKQSEQAQVEQDAALESEAGAAAARLRDSIAETRATVLITAHNPAFRDFYRAGGDRYAKIVGEGRTMDRVNGALLYLAGLYPESIVQASFVDGGGAENARIVRGSREAPHVLADDVSRDAFFRPALALRAGPRAPVASARLAPRRRVGRLLLDAGPAALRFRARPRRAAGREPPPRARRRPTTASRSPCSTPAPARSCWTAALRSRPAPSSGCPATRVSASSPARRGDGVRKLDNLRAVYRRARRGRGLRERLDRRRLRSARPRREPGRRQLAPDRARAARCPADRRCDGPALGAHEQGALTDALTGLGNRRKLVADLDARAPSREPRRGRSASCSATSTASSSTTTRSATRPGTRCWRGSATVCSRQIGVDRSRRTGSAATSSASSRRSATKGSTRSRPVTIEALSERGDGFDVGASYGGVVAAGELKTVEAALRAADQRLYASKSSGRRSAGAPGSRCAPAGAPRAPARARRPPARRRRPRRAPSASAWASPATSSTCSARPASCTTSARWRFRTRSCPSPARSTRRSGSSSASIRSSGSGSSRPRPRSPRSASWSGRATSASTAAAIPDGQAGEEIPLGARIIAVCDAYDAMIGPRPYRLGMSEEVALDELRALRGRAVRSGDRRGLLRRARSWTATEAQRSLSR